MKSYITTFLLALAFLVSCGSGTTTQNSGDISNAPVVDTMATVTKETDYTGEGALPELVFDDLTFSEIEYYEHAEVPPIIRNAKRIVIKGDEIMISDGNNETVSKIDLSSASEEANPDGYYWMFSIKDNQPVDGAFYIVAEYEEACIVRNEDPKQRPISLFFEGSGWLYPKNFNSWDNLRRKITPNYPSDEQYNDLLQYINREDPDPSDFEDYDDSGDDALETIAMKFWSELLKEYDPIGTLEGDELPDAAMIADNLQRVESKSNTIAVFEAEGAEGFTETASCYRKNDGSWIVLDYVQSNNSPDHRFTAYSFTDGDQISVIDYYFPEKFWANGRYMSSIDEDGFAVVHDTDEEEIVEWYRWNGERFVKQ